MIAGADTGKVEFMTEQKAEAMQIDLRERVLVRVKPKGLRKIERHHLRFEAMLPLALQKPLALQLDADGYIEMPLIEAVSIFGGALQTGSDEFIDPVVKIVKPVEDAQLIEAQPKKRGLLGFLS